MRDAISIARINLLHPKCRATFQKFIEDCETALNVTIRVVQGLRTFEEQQALYNQGRTTKGPVVTNAQAGSSYHNFGLSVDLAVLNNGKIDWNFDYKRFMQFMPNGMRWGGDWDGDGKTKADGDKDEHLVDMPHYELTYGHNWRDLLASYKARKFIPGSKYVAI